MLTDEEGWRGLLLTFALAAGIAAFLWRRAAAASAGAPAPISEEERRARRDRSAALAEGRAAATRAREGPKRSDNGGKMKEAADRAAGETGASAVDVAGDRTKVGAPVPVHPAAAAMVEEERGKGDDKDEPLLQEDDANHDEAEEKIEQNDIQEPKGVDTEEKRADDIAKNDDEECGAGNTDDGAPDAGESDSAVIEDGAGDAQLATGTDATEEIQDDSGHRERHAAAVAKILATKKETPEETPPATLNIYLIITSSPGAPRVELSIPSNATAEALLQSASKASNVPERALKVIFRGRIITRKTEGRVVDEFGIEEGCVLHVVGKPKLTDEEESESESESESENESEEDEEEVIDLNELRERIGRSAGEGPFHRMAQLGDLAALRNARREGLSVAIHFADSNGWTPLHEAVRAGHVEVVDFLIREVSLDANHVTNGRRGDVELFLREVGLDANQMMGGGRGSSPLELALEFHGRDHPVTRLLETFLRG